MLEVSAKTMFIIQKQYMFVLFEGYLLGNIR